MNDSLFFKQSHYKIYFLSLIKQQMNKSPKRHPVNQQYYLKKLHTESFSSPSLKDEFTKLTNKLENELQAVKKRMRVKNLKMFRAKEKLKTIENEQQQMRETLRNSIESKLKLSQTKLENMMMSKNSQSSSREKLRQTTLLRIKSMEKTSKEESFRKSQQISKDTESFLNDRKMSESRSRITSFEQTHSRTRYVQEEPLHPESMAVVESRKKVLPSVLRVTQQEIKRRQTRKDELEQSKDIKNLHEYIQKLNNIDAKRQNRSDRLAETVKLIEKERKLEQQRYSRKKAQSVGNQSANSTPARQAIRNYTSATHEAIKSKYSFSELYAKKLEEKLAKKAFFEGQSIREGDNIMRREGELRLRKRESRLIGDAIKEVQRKVNFKYMQRFRS